MPKKFITTKDMSEENKWEQISVNELVTFLIIHKGYKAPEAIDFIEAFAKHFDLEFHKKDLKNFAYSIDSLINRKGFVGVLLTETPAE